MTFLDLLKSSLRLLGVYNFGETLTADEANDGMEAFNMLIGQLSIEGMVIPYYTAEDLTFVAGQASYTIGSAGNFNTVRPIQIVGGYIRSGGTDYPFEVIGMNRYNEFSSKTTSGRPLYIHYQPSNPLGYIYCYPTPSAADTFHIDSIKPFTEITVLSTTLTFPPGYNQFLKFALAQEIEGEYGRELSAKNAQRLIMMKQALVNNNLAVSHEPVKLNLPMGDLYDNYFTSPWRLP